MRTIARVLDVAPFDHRPIGTQQGRTDTKLGVRCIGVRFRYVIRVN